MVYLNSVTLSKHLIFLKYIDYTTHVESTFPFMVSHQKDTVLVNSFLSVFGFNTWVALVVTIIAVLLGALSILYGLKDDLEIISQSSTWIHSIVGSFLCQSSSLKINRISMRILFISSLLFGLISFTVFGALLTSYLSVKMPVEQLDSLEDVEMLDLDIYLLGGSSFEGFFSTAPVGTINQRLWDKKLSKSREFRDPNYDNLLTKFIDNEKSVFLTNGKPYSFWVANNKEIGCSMTRKKVRLARITNNLGIKKNFAFKDVFNYHLHKARESGLIRLWSLDWLERFDQTEKYICSSVRHEGPIGLALENVSLAFYVVLAGAGFSAIVILFELCTRKY